MHAIDLSTFTPARTMQVEIQSMTYTVIYVSYLTGKFPLWQPKVSSFSTTKIMDVKI